jgi:pimeloyl-ACP methyl ester carboxylesterase
MASETGAEAFIGQQQAIIGRVDSRPGLGAIGCPTLVLVGDSDQLTPPELSAEITGGILGARLVVVAGFGHLTPWTNPRRSPRRSWTGWKPENPCGTRLAVQGFRPAVRLLTSQMRVW